MQKADFLNDGGVTPLSVWSSRSLKRTSSLFLSCFNSTTAKQKMYMGRGGGGAVDCSQICSWLQFKEWTLYIRYICVIVV